MKRHCPEARWERLGYMSPEQARGDLNRLGPRSDIYSLGATLYCLLTGRPPFEGDDMASVLRKVQWGEFAAPRQIDSAIDPALEAVCLKAMTFAPEERYATGRALADDIERWTAGQAVSAWQEPLSRKIAAVGGAKPICSGCSGGSSTGRDRRLRLRPHACRREPRPT